MAARQTLALVYSVFATPYELAFSFHGSFSGDSSEVAYAIADTLVVRSLLAMRGHTSLLCSSLYANLCMPTLLLGV